MFSPIVNKIKLSSEFQLREVFNSKVVERIANNIVEVYPKFKTKEFCKDTIPHLSKLSFGDRSSLITESLYKYLPKSFPKSAEILKNSLGSEIEIADLTGYDGFHIMPMSTYVSRYGKDHFDLSINLLYEMTKRFTSEWPIRTFIRLFPEQCFAKFWLWVNDSNPHVRRLVSEGTRPRLPLSSPLREFIENPFPIIELLDKLKDDPELFVRRSVANNLNDIAKDNPDAVTKTLKNWITNASIDR